MSVETIVDALKGIWGPSGVQEHWMGMTALSVIMLTKILKGWAHTEGKWGGWLTALIALGISAAYSASTYWGDWYAVIVGTGMVWLLSAVGMKAASSGGKLGGKHIPLAKPSTRQ